MRIAISAGEPAGIAPDIIVQLAQQALPAELVVIADPELLQSRAELLGLPLSLKPVDANSAIERNPAGTISIIPVHLVNPCTPGQLDVANAQYVLDSLTVATRGCEEGYFDAMVTPPVQKSVINDAGIPFMGHTEFLADLTNTPQVVMMLASNNLKVALVTTHLPLSKVPESITPELVENVTRIVYQSLEQQFGINKPRVLILGLNPHAGEAGHLGHEEIDTIIPVIDKLTGEGMNLSGPLPADTAFNPEYLENADTVIAMYHDQGLPVLKHQGFGEAINITLGLPIIRTSVDHGTALDLAASGKARHSSLQAAVMTAIALAGNRK